MKLQVNENGSWRNLVTFDAKRRDEIVAAAKVFAQVLGADVKWCVVGDDGKREWLRFFV